MVWSHELATCACVAVHLTVLWDEASSVRVEARAVQETATLPGQLLTSAYTPTVLHNQAYTAIVTNIPTPTASSFRKQKLGESLDKIALGKAASFGVCCCAVRSCKRLAVQSAWEPKVSTCTLL